MHIRKKTEQWVGRFTRLTLAGLDISDRTVKYLALSQKRNGGKLDFTAFGEFEIPEGLIVNGEIKKEDDLVQIFSSWRAGEKNLPRSAFFVVSLPEEKSFLRVIQLPKIKQEEIQNAIRWEIEANIPLAFEDVIYDYETIDSSARESLDHLDIAVTAFPKTIVESYVRVLKQAGLPIFALELESQAIVRSTIADVSEQSATVIADIGRTRTSFIVCVGWTILFTKTIELGGQLFEQRIAQNLGISVLEAEKLKKEIGLNKHEHKAAVFEALIPTVAVLGDELVRMVEYYRTHASHAHSVQPEIRSILLVGGDANLFGLETYISSMVKIPARVLDPFTALRENFRLPVPPLRKNQMLSFATVVGLALRGMRGQEV